MDKRTFLKNASLLGLGGLTSFESFGKLVNNVANIAPDATDGGNDYWRGIRNQYDLNPDYINLENGYYCIQPRPILDKYLEHIREVNLEGAHYMRTVQFENKQKAADKLAALAGCSSEELIITRNTTESLDMVISGLSWQASDEAVMAEQDYGAMLDMFSQVSKRYGVMCKKVSIPMHPENDEEIVQLYERAITPKTKLLMVCHMINITGHILPVKKICEMAHAKGVLVMVDGAHTFAHLNFKLTDLDCDFYGCSLHKWLSVPLGAGMLYIKKQQIPHVYPIFADASKKDTDVLRLNHTGTHPPAVDLTIADAIDFYLAIGRDRKEERLRYLQRYWTDQVRQLGHIKLNTPAEPTRSCAIANVGVIGMKPAELQEKLFRDYKIYTVAIDSAGVAGCRVTPNIYTSTDELNQLTNALKKMG